MPSWADSDGLQISFCLFKMGLCPDCLDSNVVAVLNPPSYVGCLRTAKKASQDVKLSCWEMGPTMLSLAALCHLRPSLIRWKAHMVADSKDRQFSSFLMKARVPPCSSPLVYAATLDAFPGCKFKPLPTTFNSRIKVIWELQAKPGKEHDRKWTAHHYGFG